MKLYRAKSMDLRYLDRSEFQVKSNHDVGQYVDHFELRQGTHPQRHIL